MCYTIFPETIDRSVTEIANVSQYYSKQRVILMKAILTIGIMWSLLITAVIAQEQVIPALRLEEPVVLTPEQHEKKS